MKDYVRELQKQAEHVEHKYADRPHLASLKTLWWALRHVFFRLPKSSFSDDKTHVKVHLLGGVGDFVVGVRYIKALSAYLGFPVAVSVDPVYEDVVDALIYAQDFVTWAEDRTYDIELTHVRYPALEFIDRKRALDEKAKRYAESVAAFRRQNYELYGNDFLGYSYCKIKGIKRINQADFDGKLGLSETQYQIKPKLKKDEVLKKFGLEENDYITVQTGGGIHFEKFTDVRQWPLDRWNEFTASFKTKYPGLKIVQLGSERQPRIDNVDLNLLGKTSFDELIILLGASKWHVQQEGGLVYVRHYLNAKPSKVIYGPTDPEFYNFDENQALSQSRGCCCEHLKHDWCKQCIKGSSQCAQLPLTACS